MTDHPITIRLNYRSAIRTKSLRDTQQRRFESALLRLEQAHPDGVIVAADTVLLSNRREIAATLAKDSSSGNLCIREYAEVGGLLVYGADPGALFERVAGYVDRIVKGTKPRDLPVQQAA